MNWSFLTNLIPMPYRILIMVTALGSFGAYMWYEGRKGPEAELDAFQKQVEAAKLKADAEAALKKAQSNELITKKDEEHEKAIVAVSDFWAAEYKRLFDANNRGGSTSKPIQISSQICDDPSGRNRLSDTLSRYRDGVRAAARQAGLRTGKLLESCDLEVKDYLNAQEWAKGEQIIHSTPSQ